MAALLTINSFPFSFPNNIIRGLDVLWYPILISHFVFFLVEEKLFQGNYTMHYALLHYEFTIIATTFTKFDWSGSAVLCIALLWFLYSHQAWLDNLTMVALLIINSFPFPFPHKISGLGYTFIPDRNFSFCFLFRTFKYQQFNFFVIIPIITTLLNLLPLCIHAWLS